MTRIIKSNNNNEINIQSPFPCCKLTKNKHNYNTITPSIKHYYSIKQINSINNIKLRLNGVGVCGTFWYRKKRKPLRNRP